MPKAKMTASGKVIIYIKNKFEIEKPGINFTIQRI